MAIALVVLNLLSIDLAIIVSIVLATALVVSIIVPKIRNAVSVPLCLGAALFACLVFMCGNTAIAPQINLANQNASASFYYVDIPEVTEDGYSYIVKTVSVDIDNAPQNIKLKIKSNEPINADAYQVVTGDLSFRTIANSAYSSYGYYAKGIYLSSTAKNLKATKYFVASPWKYIYKLRVDIIRSLSNAMNGDTGSLALALVTGYKKGISDSLYSSMKAAGVVHLIAVSGFHLTIIVGAFLCILKLFRANDLVIAIVSTFFILACIGLAGFSKSVTRAGIMMLIILWGNASKHRADMLNSLGVATAIICLNPFAVTDVGMQLSTLSTLAVVIVLFDPYRTKYQHIKNVFITPFAIMFLTLPVMTISFGYVSLAGLISNAFVSLIGSASLVASLVTYVVLKIGFLPSIFVTVTKVLIGILIKIVNFFSSCEFAVVPLDNEVMYAVVGAILMIAIPALLRKRKMIEPMACIAVLMVVVTITFSAVSNLDSAKVYVTKNGATAVVYKDEGYVCNIDSKTDYYTLKAFMFSNQLSIDDAQSKTEYENIEVVEQDDTSMIYVNGMFIMVGGSDLVGANIHICDNKIYEPRGVVELDGGDVMYKIKPDSSFVLNRIRMN